MRVRPRVARAYLCQLILVNDKVGTKNITYVKGISRRGLSLAFVRVRLSDCRYFIRHRFSQDTIATARYVDKLAVFNNLTLSHITAKSTERTF